METTIAIMERYPLLRMGLAQFLNEHFAGSSILEYESVDDLNKNRGPGRPGLAILGLNIDGPERGLTQLSCLRSNYPGTKVIVYDDLADPVKAFKYLKAGAYGYLSKTEPVINLKDGINQVLEGKKYVVKDMLDAIFEDHIFGTKRRPGSRLTLTRNESAVANHLISGLTITRIAAVLDKNVSTVSTFKRRIFEKLDVTSVPELEAKIASEKQDGSLTS